jgi:serine/threonine protein kinase
MEARQAMTEVWTKWEGEVVNGIYPLRRFLSASGHSAVFLSDHRALDLPNTALKLVSLVPTLAQAQLSHWTTAGALSHPHLIQMLDSGRCRLGGLEFLFVVMEYAEQTLSQILPHRALTLDEVREMLPPTLDALAFLHRKNLVQGQLKPSNMLVVEDQLKLASDTVRPVGESTGNIAEHSAYDPPEARDGRFSAAGDIWSLGVTMVEALTRQLPSWPDSQSETALLPAALPAEFAEVVRQCLDRNPANRPTVAELVAWINPAPPLPVVALPPLPVSVPNPPVSIPSPPVVELRGRAPAESPKHRLFVSAIAVLFVVVVAVWAGLHMFSSRSSMEPAAPPTAASQNSETSPSLTTGTATPLVDKLRSVLHEEIPDVPLRARDTIHGRINIAIRVTVNNTGDVVGETLEKRGPSRYFARLATEAARKWKFAATDDHASRKWLLRFEFTRDGATGHATMARS